MAARMVLTTGEWPGAVTGSGLSALVLVHHLANFTASTFFVLHSAFSSFATRFSPGPAAAFHIIHACCRLLKNSWGETFGEKVCCRVACNCNVLLVIMSGCADLAAHFPHIRDARTMPSRCVTGHTLLRRANSAHSPPTYAAHAHTGPRMAASTHPIFWLCPACYMAGTSMA